MQVKLRDSETKAAVNEAEIKNMELHLQNKMFEQASGAEHCSVDSGLSRMCPFPPPVDSAHTTLSLFIFTLFCFHPGLFFSGNTREMPLFFF